MNINGVEYCPDSIKACRTSGATALLIAISKMKPDKCFELQSYLGDRHREFDESREIALRTIDSVIERNICAKSFEDENAFNWFSGGAAIAIQTLSKMKNTDRQAEFAILGIMGSEEMCESHATRWIEEYDNNAAT